MISSLENKLINLSGSGCIVMTLFRKEKSEIYVNEC